MDIPPISPGIVIPRWRYLFILFQWIGFRDSLEETPYFIIFHGSNTCKDRGVSGDDFPLTNPAIRWVRLSCHKWHVHLKDHPTLAVKNPDENPDE